MKTLAASVLIVSALVACTSSSSGSSIEPFVDLGPGDPGPGGIRFTASGEALATTGYAFPPAGADDVAFVDGWAVKFERLLVTVDHVTLSEAPDTSAGDPSLTGKAVGHIDGPWAIDLAKDDPSNLRGKGGPDEQAIPFASIANDGLATDGTRYAFGFDLVAPSATAKLVNVPAGDADYAEMTAKGCNVFYVGTATFEGDKTDAACYPDDRKTWPDKVHFRLCFPTPSTYVNCQNPDNDPARALGDEEHQRGLALKASQAIVAQVTIHTDHPFWDSTVHDAPAHFDQFAARVSDRSGEPTVTLEDVKGVDYTAYTDEKGTALAWRYCVEPPTDAHPKLTGAMSFDPGSVPHAIGGDPSSGLRDYYDFTVYDQSTQGHLNADGLCYVRRNYASPP